MERSRVKTVAVVGSSKAIDGDGRYKAAFDVGRGLVNRGFRVVTGGRGGVMEAACRGAHTAEAYREGVTVAILPGRSPDQANPYVDIAIPTGLNIARNAIIAHSDGVIGIGGGSGTLAELAMAWQLGRPVITVDLGGWSGRLGGERLDDRPSPTGKDDRVWKAEDPKEAVQMMEKLLEKAFPKPRRFSP